MIFPTIISKADKEVENMNDSQAENGIQKSSKRVQGEVKGGIKDDSRKIQGGPKKDTRRIQDLHMGFEEDSRTV